MTTMADPRFIGRESLHPMEVAPTGSERVVRNLTDPGPPLTAGAGGSKGPVTSPSSHAESRPGGSPRSETNKSDTGDSKSHVSGITPFDVYASPAQAAREHQFSLRRHGGEGEPPTQEESDGDASGGSKQTSSSSDIQHGWHAIEHGQ